jgi:hypothetical protein
MPSRKVYKSNGNSKDRTLPKYREVEEIVNKTTDEGHLHRYFHYYLKTMYVKLGKTDPKYMFMDGFEEPLDPDYLCKAIYELADRLGYKLVDNMWENK